MKGKEKCKALREIRRQIALENDIKYVTDECKFQGECRGTCPKCEAEVRFLEKELERKQAIGKSVAVVGLSIGMFAPIVGCNDLPDIGDQELGGEPTLEYEWHYSDYYSHPDYLSAKKMDAFAFAKQFDIDDCAEETGLKPDSYEDCVTEEADDIFINPLDKRVKKHEHVDAEMFESDTANNIVDCFKENDKITLLRHNVSGEKNINGRVVTFNNAYYEIESKESADSSDVNKILNRLSWAGYFDLIQNDYLLDDDSIDLFADSYVTYNDDNVISFVYVYQTYTNDLLQDEFVYVYNLDLNAFEEMMFSDIFDETDFIDTIRNKNRALGENGWELLYETADECIKMSFGYGSDAKMAYYTPAGTVIVMNYEYDDERSYYKFLFENEDITSQDSENEDVNSEDNLEMNEDVIEENEEIFESEE